MSKLDSNESDGKGLFIIRNGKKVAKYEAGKWVPLLPGVAVSVTRHALRLKCRIKPPGALMKSRFPLTGSHNE